ncbi:hypothetical protein BSL78_07164 [Apostichopus japonicus]|uniref:Uncharacterized protein n=1 Tax=Stichopus japonicus TaxID=307972 RepID=A0A2G8L6Q1_STIJA|nr:hypothetical protein BSL78_07164 [Apostichopus japonicus]
MSEQVVVRTLGRFGKVTGYEEPEFLECKGVKTGTRRVRIELKSDIPSTLWANGHRAHIASRASLALVGGVGWKGMRPGCARTSGVAAVYRLGIPWPSVKGISFELVWENGPSARLCPDRSYAARVATGVVEAVPVPASDTVPLMLLSSPQCPTLAPRWRLCSPFRVRPLP